MKTSPAAVVLALLVTLALGTVFASPAAAHDALKSSDPAKGAKVESLREAKLTFTAKVRFPVVVVHASDGTPRHEGKAVADGQVVTQRLKDDLPPGGYVIAYRVVSSDGHPIEGEIPFTLTGAKEPSPSEPPSGSFGTSGPATAAPPTAGGSSSAGTDAPAPVAETEKTDGPEPSGGAPAWMWVVVGGVTGVGIGLFLSMRNGKRQP